MRRPDGRRCIPVRLIDASQFDRMILPVPYDVYDPGSFIRGVEAVLERVRSAETVVLVNDEVFGKMLSGKQAESNEREGQNEGQNP